LTGGDLNTQHGFTGGLGENYGMRVYGWVTPKVSGNYTFFLRSDEASELWLSPDADPANLRKALIAYETGCCEPFKEPDPGNVFTTSEPRNLTAGRSYFIEAFLSEGAGGDYVEVAWRREGDTTPAANLMPI